MKRKEVPVAQVVDQSHINSEICDSNLIHLYFFEQIEENEQSSITYKNCEGWLSI